MMIKCHVFINDSIFFTCMKLIIQFVHVVAGETSGGEPLFVGRARHEGTITLGKVQPSHGVCYIPYGGQEIAYDNYEILCC